MFVTMKDMTGNQVGEIELSDSIFAAPVNTSLMHQALVRQLANARQGTHSTKTRSEVRGGGRKPWRQKGTGRARHGSIRSPIWVGGGTIFGPRPRKYTKQMPKKMRRAALRSALTVKANAGQLIVLDNISMEAPKTKAMVELLDALGIDDQSVLLVLPQQAAAVQRSARNLPQVKTLLANYLNIHDLLGYDAVVLSHESLKHIENWLALENGVEPLAERDSMDGEAAAVDNGLDSDGTQTGDLTHADESPERVGMQEADAATEANAGPNRDSTDLTEEK